jgi:hypothetical protein
MNIAAGGLGYLVGFELIDENYQTKRIEELSDRVRLLASANVYRETSK